MRQEEEESAATQGTDFSPSFRPFWPIRRAERGSSSGKREGRALNSSLADCAHGFPRPRVAPIPPLSRATSHARPPRPKSHRSGTRKEAGLMFHLSHFGAQHSILRVESRAKIGERLQFESHRLETQDFQDSLPPLNELSKDYQLLPLSEWRKIKIFPSSCGRGRGRDRGRGPGPRPRWFPLLAPMAPPDAQSAPPKWGRANFFRRREKSSFSPRAPPREMRARPSSAGRERRPTRTTSRRPTRGARRR